MAKDVTGYEYMGSTHYAIDTDEAKEKTMKLLLFVVITTWSFCFPLPDPTIQIVSSPKDAALLIWEDGNLNGYQTEPDQKEHRLYEVDLEKGSVKQVEIPQVRFE